MGIDRFLQKREEGRKGGREEGKKGRRKEGRREKRRGFEG